MVFESASLIRIGSGSKVPYGEPLCFVSHLSPHPSMSPTTLTVYKLCDFFVKFLIQMLVDLFLPLNYTYRTFVNLLDCSLIFV